MAPISKTKEFITFTLNKELYAIEVSKIESILEYTKVTTLPGVDHTIRGVINLRGRALPVIDLRSVLNIEESEINQDTSIIVLFVETGDKTGTLGALVDSVKEVVEIPPEQIQDAPKVGVRINSDYITGIAKNDDDFIIILDIDKILNEDQKAVVSDEDLVLPEDSEEELRSSSEKESIIAE